MLKMTSPGTMAYVLVMASAVCFSASARQWVNTGDRYLQPGLCQQILDADPSDTFINQQDYVLNLQGKTYSSDTVDRAPRKLFQWVDESKLRKLPTFSALVDLLDNYVLRTGTKETLTQKEIQETWRFLHAVMATNTMKIAHKYLVEQGLATKDVASFKKLLLKIWFYYYRRATDKDSSSFEHVFVGEITKRRSTLKVGGFHNWVKYYLMEKAGKVDYKGYHRYQSNEPSFLAHRMSLGNVSKPYSSFFIGTSPEFELALYTICFLKFPDGECNCKINSRRVKITTYGMRGTNSLGTAYPDLY